MPGEPIGDKTILAYRDQRFKLEQLLALDVVEAITTTPSLIEPLRQMARAAITEIQSFVGGGGGSQAAAAIRSAFAGESGLAIWKKTGTGAGLRGLGQMAVSTHLSVFDISDIIRLYGSCVEKLAENPEVGRKYKPELEKKEGYRSAVGYATKDIVWKKGRVRGDPVDPKTVATEKAGASLRGWQVPDIPSLNARGIQPMLKRGIDIKQATANSTVKKIEDLFGLPLGADISGTTADSIYFVEKFCAKCNIPYDPAYQMLPLASIVRARHHALLEVALTLSSHGIVNYHIGFYTTLEPAASTHPGVGKLRGVFKKWEGHNWNQHIIVYFDQANRIDGGWLFGDQLGKYARLADVYLNYQDFVSLAKPPLYGHVLALLKKYDLIVKR